jgi:hypothetical protein
MPPVNHPNVISTWTVLELTGDNIIENVLMVETDLYLNAEHPQYDRERVDALLATVQKFMKSNEAINRTRIIPNRRA